MQKSDSNQSINTLPVASLSCIEVVKIRLLISKLKIKVNTLICHQNFVYTVAKLKKTHCCKLCHDTLNNSLLCKKLGFLYLTCLKVVCRRFLKKTVHLHSIKHLINSVIILKFILK